ncbi:hypothetical protein G1H11_21825 [Phytoactinopolyspora alkaliphila]|uniref:Uncharacterized protein n=1 Tax=Phytoactinopolyspora alkaliphila TaxID=1783498 RepID=A0A6N9YSI4_9ACTN|nr:hypothetical protein [Phytoactinopolyspora alkaliphila]NED97942.1 hypothetical protein [Phytoactinopolyspora alkaliphila]
MTTPTTLSGTTIIELDDCHELSVCPAWVETEPLEPQVRIELTYEAGAEKRSMAVFLSEFDVEDIRRALRVAFERAATHPASNTRPNLALVEG